MLQPRQPPGERLVGLHQLRELTRLRADLLVLHGDPLSLAAHHDDQLVT